MNRAKLIQIGESLHASIPRPGAALKELVKQGASAFDRTSEPLNYIISLITSQIDNHADYLAVNVDEFAGDDPQPALALMQNLVELVKKHGQNIPVCIDSSNNHILKAGLSRWYYNSPDNLAVPLINSVKTYTLDDVLPLRRQYPFKVIGLLVDDKKARTDGACSVDALYDMALTIFAAATQKYHFQPDDLFFDSTVFPLAIDMPMMPGNPGYTCRAFEAIKKIMTDPHMKGVHTSLGISNCARDLPGRKVGLCRAYLAVAQNYGLDAAIVNVTHNYGTIPPDPQLVRLVQAFADQDGAEPSNLHAMKLMTEFCRQTRKQKITD